MEVKDILEASYNMRCQHISPASFSSIVVQCQDALAKWKRSKNLNANHHIQKLQSDLHQAYTSPTLDFSVINTIKSQLLHAYRHEEDFWKAKSGIHWLQAVDRNTKFFQAMVKQMRSYNRINVLEDVTGHFYKN